MGAGLRREMMKKVTLVQTGLWLKGSDHTKTIIFEDEEDAWRYCLRYYGIKDLDRVNRQKTPNFRGVFRTNKRWVLITQVKFKEK